MGKYLKLELWYDKQATGTLKMKRVSARKECQFPREYRVMLRDHGASKTVKYIMEKKNISLQEAWHNLKMMVNGK